jgi:hypothetical protein
MSEYQIGTTVVLQAVYYNNQNQPLDADANPTVEVRDAKNRTIQTGLVSTRTGVGTYECKFKTTNLPKGTYFYVFNALFGGFPDEKAGSFTLKEIVT